MKKKYAIVCLLMSVLGMSAQETKYSNGLFVVCNNVIPYKNGQINFFDTEKKEWKDNVATIGWSPYVAVQTGKSLYFGENSEGAILKLNVGSLAQEFKQEDLGGGFIVPKNLCPSVDEKNVFLATDDGGSNAKGLRIFNLESKKDEVMGEPDGRYYGMVATDTHLFAEKDGKKLDVFDIATKTVKQTIDNATHVVKVRENVGYFDIDKKKFNIISATTFAQVQSFDIKDKDLMPSFYGVEHEYSQKPLEILLSHRL